MAPEAAAQPRPFLAYSIHRDCFASKVPLVAQISWMVREGRGEAGKVDEHFHFMVTLEASPVLERPLEGVAVTVSGLPAVGSECSLACSPRAEVCLASREVRWRWQGQGSEEHRLRLRPGQRVTVTARYATPAPPPPAEPFVLKARVRFRSSQALSGLGLGKCGDLAVKSHFRSGEYFCTSEYPRPPALPC